jgi:proline iminopeptidase
MFLYSYTVLYYPIKVCKKHLFLLLLCLWGCYTTPAHSQIIIEKEGFLYVNGASIFYKTVGSGEPILVLHGGPGLDHSYLYPQLNELAKTHKLIFFDQRASGKSSPGRGPSSVALDTMIYDIEVLREKFNIKKINIIAHSWGGILAMKYAIKYHKKVKSIVLMSSLGASSELNDKANDVIQARLTKKDKQQKKEIQGSKDYWAHGQNSYRKLMLLSFKHDFYNPKLVDSLHLKLNKKFYENSKLLQNLAKDLKTYDFYEELCEVRAPVLLLYGDFDPLSGEVANKLKENFHHAELVVLPNCGHFPYIELPSEVFLNVANFYKHHKIH